MEFTDTFVWFSSYSATFSEFSIRERLSGFSIDWISNLTCSRSERSRGALRSHIPMDWLQCLEERWQVLIKIYLACVIKRSSKLLRASRRQQFQTFLNHQILSAKKMKIADMKSFCNVSILTAAIRFGRDYDVLNKCKSFQISFHDIVKLNDRLYKEMSSLMKDRDQERDQKDSKLSEQSVARMFGFLTRHFIPFSLSVPIVFPSCRLKDLFSLIFKIKNFT